MGTNALPPSIDDLLQLAGEMDAGLTQLGSSLEITQITPAILQTRIAGFTNVDKAFNLARNARLTALSTSATFHEDISVWLTRARAALVPYLGNSWSAAWVAAGFVNNSTSVQGSVGSQLKLLRAVANYFTDHPSYEDPGIGITGAAGAALAAQSVAADVALNDAKTASGTKKDARTAALLELKGAMRLLVRILDDKLPSLDPRWTTFGLNMPGADTTPAAPLGLAASFTENLLLSLTCQESVGATRYRWRGRIVGVEEDYTLLASTKSPFAQVADLMPGQQWELIVQAANYAAQSLPSESVLITVPLSVTALHSTAPTSANGAAEPAQGFTFIPSTTGNGTSRKGRKVERNGARH